MNVAHKKENTVQRIMSFPRTRQGVRNLDAVQGSVLPVSGGPAPRPNPRINVGANERLCCSLAGGALALFGLSRVSWAGLAIAAVGGALLYRGTTGHCYLYSAMGVNTAGKASPNEEIVYSRD
jgi:Protein of unknown function (DUF2892)